MNAFISEFANAPLAQRIGWSLLHFLWQGIIVAAVLRVVLQILRRHPAQSRYLAACMAMGTMVLLPIATALLISPSPHAQALQSTAKPAELHDRPEFIGQASAEPQSPPAMNASAPRHAALNDQIHSFISLSLPWIVPLWLSGMLAMSLWQTGGWLIAQRMRRLGAPVQNTALAEIFARLRDRLGMTIPVRLLQSAMVRTPVVIGWIRPVILLPASILTQLSGQQIQAILAHELAHIKRWDYLVRMIQAMVETVLFFHPAVWWVSRRMSQESEICCDEFALKICPDRREYAMALAIVAGAMESFQGLSLAASGGMLLPRLRRILGLPIERSGKKTLLSAGFVLALVAIVILMARTNAAEPAAVGGSAAAGQITGIVVDEKGIPVAGATVETSIAAPNERSFALPSARTGTDGHFKLNAENSDNVYTEFVRAFLPDGSQQGFLNRWDAKSNAMSRDLKIVLKPAREITTTVKNKNGQPIAGAQVAAVSAQQLVGETVSDASGKAILRVPADAPLGFVFADRNAVGFDYFAVWSKNAIHRDPYHLAADFSDPLEFVLSEAKTVTIAVQDEQHTPVAGARVSPWTVLKPGKGDAFNFSGLHSFDQFTDAKGIAQFSIIPSDVERNVVFWTNCEGFTTQHRTEWYPAAGKDELTVTLDRLVRISGQVIAEDGSPVIGVIVRAGGAGSARTSDTSAVSQSGGDFSIAVNPRQYVLIIAQKDHAVSAPWAQVIEKTSPTTPIELKLKPGIRFFGTATAGEDNHPLPGLPIGLTMVDDSYSKLPRDQQVLPARVDIKPAISQMVQTATDGSYEFYVSAGDFELTCISGDERVNQSFKKVKKDFQYDIHFKSNETQAEPVRIHGHVVLADKPETPVQNSMIRGETLIDQLRREATSDRSGDFEMAGAKVPFLICATSADRKFGAIVSVNPNDSKLSVPLAPTGSARGRLMDSAGKPINNQTINIGILIEEPSTQPRRFMNTFARLIKTGDDGTFIADGLIPGREYAFTSVAIPDEHGVVRLLSVARITPDPGKTLELGDITPRAATRPSR